MSGREAESERDRCIYACISASLSLSFLRICRHARVLPTLSLSLSLSYTHTQSAREIRCKPGTLSLPRANLGGEVEQIRDHAHMMLDPDHLCSAKMSPPLSSSCMSVSRVFFSLRETFTTKGPSFSPNSMTTKLFPFFFAWRQHFYIDR